MIDTIRSGTLARRLALAATLTLAAVVAGWVASYFSLDVLDKLRDVLPADNKREVLAIFLRQIAGSSLAILVAAALARGAEALEPGAPLARGSRTAAATMAWISVVAAIGHVVLKLAEGDDRFEPITTVVFGALLLIGLSFAAAVLAGGAASDDVEAELDAEYAAEDAEDASLEAAEEDDTPPPLVANEPPAAPYRAWDAPARIPDPTAPSTVAPDAPALPSDPAPTMLRPSEDPDPPTSGA